MKLLAVVLSLQAFLLPFFVLGVSLMRPNSTINYNGETVPVGLVRLEVVGSMLAWFVIAVFLGPGLWHGKPRARDALMALVLFTLAYKLFVMGYWADLPLDLPFTAIIAWYLYLKPNVAAYFRPR